VQNRVWAYAALGIVAALLLVTAQVTDVSRLLVVAVLAALGATWIELTRRQTLVEFPDAQGTTFFADTWDRVTTWWGEQRAAAAARSPAPSPPPSVPAATDLSARLASLAELHGSGALSDDEFATAKARVLAGE
jgi:hypothetical protein